MFNGAQTAKFQMPPTPEFRPLPRTPLGKNKQHATIAKFAMQEVH
jgi:hypothetical protein